MLRENNARKRTRAYSHRKIGVRAGTRGNKISDKSLHSSAGRAERVHEDNENRSGETSQKQTNKPPFAIKQHVPFVPVLFWHTKTPQHADGNDTRELNASEISRSESRGDRIDAPFAETEDEEEEDEDAEEEEEAGSSIKANEWRPCGYQT